MQHQFIVVMTIENPDDALLRRVEKFIREAADEDPMRISFYAADEEGRPASFPSEAGK